MTSVRICPKLIALKGEMYRLLNLLHFFGQNKKIPLIVWNNMDTFAGAQLLASRFARGKPHCFHCCSFHMPFSRATV